MNLLTEFSQVRDGPGALIADWDVLTAAMLVSRLLLSRNRRSFLIYYNPPNIRLNWVAYLLAIDSKSCSEDQGLSSKVLE